MYIDNILVMVETESLLKDHVTAVVYLQENLKFVSNHPKLELTPAREIEYLGFTVNSTAMELGQGSKRSNVRQATHSVSPCTVVYNWEDECSNTGYSYIILQGAPVMPLRGSAGGS